MPLLKCITSNSFRPNQFDLLEQHRVGNEAGGGEPRNKCLAGKMLFRFGIVVAHDGIADEEDARKIRFIRMGNPDVAPLDGFVRGRTCTRFGSGKVAGKSRRQGKVVAECFFMT